MVLTRYIVLVLVIFLGGFAAATPAPQPQDQFVMITPDISDKMPAQAFVHSDFMAEDPGKANFDEEEASRAEWPYGEIRIKKLNALLTENYAHYAKYAHDGMIYIIVHPAYYVFFHNNVPVIHRDSDNSGSNILDVLIKEMPDDPASRLIQQQQINENSFVKHASAEKKLLILILPNDYERHSNYSYNPLKNEYARHINEITDGSDSVLYIESTSPTGGKLSTEDLIMLLSFINSAGARSILIGGGYVGRCQEEFYNEITGFATGGNYFIVPEISVFSPEDISEKKAVNLLDDKRIDFQAASEFVISGTGGDVKIHHLSPWDINAISNMQRPHYNGKNDSAILKKEDIPIEEPANNNFEEYIYSFCSMNDPLLVP